MNTPPIFVVTGPPGAGKTTLSRALLARYPLGLHVPVDDLRELWVVSGQAGNFGWTEETTRQFALAEQAAADLAVRYQAAGFAVAIDHCAGPPSLDALIHERFAGLPVVRLVALPDLEINLLRNRVRTDKSFDPERLTPTIQRLNPLFWETDLSATGWLKVDTNPDVSVVIPALLALLGPEHRPAEGP